MGCMRRRMSEATTRQNQPEPSVVTGVCLHVPRWLTLSLALVGCVPAATTPRPVIQVSAALRAPTPEEPDEPDEPELPKPPGKLPPTRPRDGTVLVPMGARLFEGPGLWLQSAKTGYVLNDDRLERIRPMQVVGEAGEFFAIRTHHAESEGDHCYATRNLFRRYDLVVYLPKDDVLPVLTEQVQRVWIGGPALQLDPGLGLYHLDKDRYRVVAWPFSIELEVPAQSVGKLYRPATGRTSVRWPMTGVELRNRRAKLTIGNGVDAQLLGRYSLIDEVANHPEGALVTMRTQCAKIQAVVPPSEVVSVDEERSHFGYGTSCGGVQPGVDFQIPSRTRVFWRDGRSAGWTSQPATLHAYDRKDIGDLACFPESPNSRGCGRDRLQLCVRSDELAIIPVKG
jgi:hypothetical protein